MKKHLNRILAVDAGFENTGWAIVSGGLVRKTGCIVTSPVLKKLDSDASASLKHAARCQHLTTQFTFLLLKYEIAGVVCEMPLGGGKNSKAVMGMASAATVMVAVTTIQGVSAHWVSPYDVKRIAKVKRATKADVRAVVLQRWPDALKGLNLGMAEHVGDALGAYLAAENSGLVRMLNQQGVS